MDGLQGMNLRNQLLTYFGIVILTAVSIYGWSAYQIAYDVGNNQKNILLSNRLQEQAGLLAQVKLDRDNIKNIEKALYSPASEDLKEYMLSSIIADSKGNILVPENQLSLPNAGLRTYRLDHLVTGKTTQGAIVLEEQTYLWMKAAIPGTENVLLYIFRGKDDHTFSNLASRIIVVSIFILWVSVWVALILATKVTNALRAKSDEIEHQASHDSLTGLPNRLWLSKKLENEIKHASVSNKHIALMLIDMNRFKQINNTLGHEAGDELLKEVSKSLQSCLWKSDSIVRMGGDEFALLMPITNEDHCFIALDKILDIMDEPVIIDGIPLEIDISLGMAVYPKHAEDATNLIRCAEVAMYLAKERGAQYTIYDINNDPHSIKQLRLSGELRQAAKLDQLSLHYQPKMNIHSNEITGVEALLRWTHPQHGNIPPDEFIPIAEQTGSIASLTYWVLHTAIEQCASWHNNGLDIDISVNLSARMLHDFEMPNRIMAILEKHGLPASKLELEITETAIIMEPDKALSILKRLHDVGIQLSIDDFGTGYTSIAYLKRLPARYIKIDKSFVLEMHSDRESATIVQTIIDLSHSMGIEVIAEGVEDRETLAELVSLGCDTIQGYYLSRPMPIEQFETWLSQDQARVQTGPPFTVSKKVISLNT